MDDSLELYRGVLADRDDDAMRRLCREDLFYLLVVGFGRKDIVHPWLYDRVREVAAEPDGHLDLWSREHYKSTIITYGLTIQDLLRNPEETVGLFSHTRPIAKAFLAQIKRELEGNDYLKSLFPDVLWQEPHRESPCWSLDNGIVLKRRTNPKEKTIEAWGLVDGQPISKHFSLLVYDDVVTKASVSTPEQIVKTTEAWELSLNLGAHGGRERFIGTRYHNNDTYRTIIEREAATPRIYPATEDGTPSGRPVFISQESLDEKRRKMGPYTFGAQMLQNPVADSAQGFREEWLQKYDVHKFSPRGMNIYITVDPASEKKRDSDYTAILVHALGPDGNYYLVDGCRARMNLTERCDRLFDLVRKWNPIAVGYEKYGLQADIEHVKFVQELQNFRFKIVPLGGSMPKNDRIRRLVPVFEGGRYYMPVRLLYADHEGRTRDLVYELVHEEYLGFPVALHDDGLDCASRILDPELGASFPSAGPARQAPTIANNRYDPFSRRT